MKIGIVVYSQTGHTQSVAQKLEHQLVKLGNEVVLERLNPAESGRRTKDACLSDLPALDGYQALIFCSPVHGFALAPAMKGYLQQMSLVSALPVALLLTQSFPHPWMGGKQAMGQMQQICRQKGAVVKGDLIVNWSSSRREQQISDGVQRLSRLFS